MGEQKNFKGPRDLYREIKRSEDYLHTTAKTRSAIRHDLMDHAEKTNNEDLWLDIGLSLIRSCDVDDLASQVSDHFVEKCPDTVFMEVAEGSPSKRFVRWRKRAYKYQLQSAKVDGKPN